MAGYGFWGGMAQGFSEGQKLVENHRAAEEKKRKREREREAEALTDAAINLPGSEVDPDNPMTSAGVLERRANAEKNRPSLFGFLRPRLDTEAAAGAAGIPTQRQVAAQAAAPMAAGIPTAQAGQAVAPAPAPAEAGIPTTPPAAGEQAASPEAGEVDEVQVVGPPRKRYGQADQIRLLIDAALKRGEEGVAVQLMGQLHEVETRDFNRELVLASQRGVPALVNMADRVDEAGEWNAEELDDKPGFYRITRNGEEVGTWDKQQALDAVAAYAQQDPYLPEKMGMARSAARRLDIKLAADIETSRVRLGHEEQRIALAQRQQQLNEYKAQLDAAQVDSTLQTQLLERRRIELGIAQMEQGVAFWDAAPTLDPYTMPEAVAYAARADAGINIKDADGNPARPHSTVVEQRKAVVDAQYAEAQKEYPQLKRVQHQGRSFYVVEGVKGPQGGLKGFTTIDAAVAAARAAYPRRQAPSKK